MPLRIQSAHGRPGNGPANLSKTAGAEGPKDLTLNPDEGPAQMGTRPEFARPRGCADLVRTSKTRLRLTSYRGAGFSDVVLPGSLRVNF